MNVTSEYCDVMPYTICMMIMSNTTMNLTQWKYEYQSVYGCSKQYKNATYVEKKPQCTRVPKKRFCTSKWKVHPTKGKVRLSFLSTAKLRVLTHYV